MYSILQHIDKINNYNKLIIIIDLSFDCFETFDDSEILRLICNYYNNFNILIKLKCNLLNNTIILLNNLIKLLNHSNLSYTNEIVDNYNFISLVTNNNKNKIFSQIYQNEIIFPINHFKIRQRRQIIYL